jgi:hypothetical protein
MKGFSAAWIVVLSTVTCLAVQAERDPTAAKSHESGAKGEINLTATSANVSQSGSPVKIRILRWSTDDERRPVVAALAPPTALASGAAQGTSGSAPEAAAARGRGGPGRGGRGRRGGRGDAAAPLTPIAALTRAIASAPTVGYIWTSDITGYSIKYAYRRSLPDGGERIILATDRRLGAYSAAWSNASSSPANDYEFTLVEMRLDAKGLGEGKTSLTTKVILDEEAKTVALEDYATTPTILQNIKR